MSEADPFKIALGSEEFRRICEQLNRLEPDADALCSFDGMSGAFKFSDEGPRTFIFPETLELHLVAVLRQLFGYRISLVLGQPRADLATCWVAARKLAPKWPGFSESRCSSVMLSVAEDCIKRSAKLAADTDAWEDRFRAKGS